MTSQKICHCGSRYKPEIDHLLAVANGGGGCFRNLQILMKEENV